MPNLFVSYDLNTNSSGGIICNQELEALASIDSDIIKIGHNNMSPDDLGLPNTPFLQDYLTMEYIASLNVEKIDLCHIYSAPFTNTIRYLRAKGIKTTNTIAAHDIKESIKEFQNLGYEYPFNHISNEKLWKIYGGCIREADIVITPSKLSAEFLRKEGAKDIRIIPHGVNIPMPDKIKSIDEKQFDVGFLGSHGPDKGLKYLIQSWSKLGYKDSSLIIAGSQTEQLGSLINRFATNGNFHLAGYVPDISDFYNRISVYVQPSVTEGFGIEILEAMSYGRPVICSDGAGAADCITDGLDGFIVPKRSPESISDKINWFKDHPKELIKIGNAAREKSLNYSWDKIRQRYIGVWNSITQQKVDSNTHCVSNSSMYEKQLPKQNNNMIHNNMIHNNNNVILGLSFRLEFDALKPFLYSLAKTNFNGDLCLMVANTSNETLNSLSLLKNNSPNYRINIIPFEINIDYNTWNTHWSLYRHILYRDYLIEYFKNNDNKDKYNIMLTDTRDVLFQRDPFDFDINNSLCCFLEDKSKSISTCPFNSEWINYMFGKNVLDEIGSNMISCAGVNIGNYRSIMSYLTVMIDYINTLGNKAYIDQGIHNYIIHKNILGNKVNLRLFENGKGPVLTMQYMKDIDIIFNNDGLIINYDGSIPSVLHQYDRRPAIYEKIKVEMLN